MTQHDTAAMLKYCLVCDKELGPRLTVHCTDRSVVAMKREGFFRKQLSLYSLDGHKLTEDDLSRMKAIEVARALTREQNRKGTPTAPPSETPPAPAEAHKMVIDAPLGDSGDHSGRESRLNASLATLRQGDQRYSQAWVDRWKAAAHSLGEIRDGRAVEPLVEAALQDFNNQPLTTQNRQAMADALRKIGDPSTVDVLAAKLRTPGKPGVRAAAADTLGQLRDLRAVEPLIAALWDMPDGGMKYAADADAARALGELGDPRAVEPLIKKVGVSGAREPVTAAALHALGQIGDRRAVDLLIRMLSRGGTDHDYVTIAAAGALGHIRDPRATERLLDLAIHEYIFDKVQAAARAALVQIGDSRVVRLALEWLGGADSTADQCISAAKLLLVQTIQSNAATLAPEDLRAVANVRDTWRTVRSLRHDSTTGDREPVETFVKIDNADLRQTGEQELARRGLRA